MTEKSLPGNGVVVVGVDGSEPSRLALRFAIEDARRRQARLRVVAVYDTSSDAFIVAYGGPQVWMDNRPEIGRKMAERLIADELGEQPTDLDLTVEVRSGMAAAILIQLSADADLLVVGSRGHGGFRGLVLGSVSQQCVLHASCPVTVVHSGTGRSPRQGATGAVDAEPFAPRA